MKPTLTNITAQIFGKLNRVTRTEELSCAEKKWVSTRQTEIKVMRQTRTDETEEKRYTKKGEFQSSEPPVFKKYPLK